MDTKILVDYLAFTICRDEFLPQLGEDYDGRYLLGRMCRKFYLPADAEWSEAKAWYGYALSYKFAGIVLCFGGRDDIYLQMSGQGCRTWESNCGNRTWLGFIRLLQDTYPSFHIARLDIACDTFGMLDVPTIQKATAQQKYVSRWRKYRIVAGNDENAVYFGSPSSDFRLRIYDKTQERRHMLGDEVEVPEQWTRAEFQLRNESAAAFVREWLAADNISEAYFGIMRNNLRFWKKYDGIHTDLIQLTPWWSKFLGNYQKIKLAYQGGLEYNLDNLERFVFHQAGSSIRTYLEIYDGDVDRLLTGVKDRNQNERQRELVARMRQDR